MEIAFWFKSDGARMEKCSADWESLTEWIAKISHEAK